jgi:hypothetical protein
MVTGPPAWPTADTRLQTRPPEWAAVFVYFLSSRESEGTKRSAWRWPPGGARKAVKLRGPNGTA